jgi:hypothetical protein
MGIIPAEEIRLAVARRSTAFTLFLVDIVASASCVSNDAGLKG